LDAPGVKQVGRKGKVQTAGKPSGLRHHGGAALEVCGALGGIDVQWPSHDDHKLLLSS